LVLGIGDQGLVTSARNV